MKRKFIKLDDEGKEILNEDGTFQFEEIDFPTTNTEVTEKPKTIDLNVDDLIKETTEKVMEALNKKANTSEAVAKIEQTPEVKENGISYSSGFDTSMLSPKGVN